MSCRFSDRDLVMRFRGGGVGHKSTRQATDFFKKDRDRLDMTRPNVSYDEDVDEEDSEVFSEEEHVDEDEEEDFGYVRDESDESEGELAEAQDDEFGPEDDGGTDMMGELGYGNL